MVRLENGLANLAFGANLLLLFLLLFESHIQLPGILQVAGRGHPLVLHLPIGILFLLALLPLWPGGRSDAGARRLQRFAIHIAAVTAAVTALAGLFLAQEGGYSPEQLRGHKWTGVGVSLGSYLLLLLARRKPFPGPAYYAALYTSAALMLWAGHLGGSITHGADFLLEPLRSPEPPVTPATPVFQAAVDPVLQGKCVACHNERKSKGQLIMTSPEALQRGGENGPIWVAGHPGESEMLRRVRLPLNDEYHMPPEGKAQLTSAEIELLERWVAAGADLTQPIAAWLEVDSLRPLVAPLLEAGAAEAPAYSFAPAAPETIQQLNSPYRTVLPLAVGSPALQADLFVRGAYRDAFLRELEAVREQLVYLNLSNLPVTDADLDFIATFPHLEKLILNGTDITGATLGALRACTRLRRLALSNTAVDAEALAALRGLPALETVSIWNTAVTEAELPALREAFGATHLDAGYQPESAELLQLPPPQLDEDRRVLEAGETVALENKFPGAEIRYTLDGSEPDSLDAPVYRGPIPVEGLLQLRARTYKAGWLSSETVGFTFFRRGRRPDSASLAHRPAPRYRSKEVETLFDGKKGRTTNFRDGSWIGFRDDPFDLTIDLGEDPVPLRRVAVSYLQNMGSYIMPPRELELFAGDAPGAMRRIERRVLDVPTGYGPNRVSAEAFDLEGLQHRYLRLVVRPIRRLPSWHQGSGSPGWVFIDEIFLYP